jgi:hypothetical protein
LVSFLEDHGKVSEHHTHVVLLGFHERLGEVVVLGILSGRLGGEVEERGWKKAT